ncbi:unnamed protein product [Linum tenue]|uniref:RNase H type-1 domain-containing protein n=2 Tax=Linum tenue TaxID=586396 RepID=A0AAV0K8M5_9ROSI|nr:unnamed protein product [Linum tenue]
MGWIQLQSDGSVLAQTGAAAAGGLLRDHLGHCVEAFTCNLGRCSITAAELKGAVEGLKIAWNRGYRKVHLKMDSTTAIEIIRNRENEDHRHGSIASQFRQLLNLEWEVKIDHVYREANFAADYLANLGHDFHFGTHNLNVRDSGLVQWLCHDVLGTSHERSVNMI